jgi:hypothetical protein
MPRYFFHINGSKDIVGEELADNETALHEATLISGDLFKSTVRALRPGLGWRLDVANEQQTTIYTIRVSAE